MKEMNSKFYDDVYIKLEKYQCDYKKAVDYPFWKRVIERLPRNKKLLEIGSGTGQFAQMLYSYGYRNYVGFDFSEEAINISRKLSPQNVWKKNAYDKNMYKNYDILICLEVLEHLDDIKVLSLIPKGSRLLFSVPDFTDIAHLRYFTSFDEFYKYYKKYIDIKYYEKINKYHFVDCIIK